MDPPTTIDPYATLKISATATAAEVRSAYRKLALHLHPDKAAPEDRDNAHKAFQELAFAYAILSDERRRKRYDATGNTSESLDLDDDDFNWGDFFRTQYSELVTAERIADFQKSYQGTEEERRDVLEAYRKGKGSLDRVFEYVVLSNPLDDEERFRKYIDEAIESGEVESLKAYTEESAKSRQRRHKRAQKEKGEAEAYAEELGSTKGKGSKEMKKSKNGPGDITDLALMIQQRNEQRRGNFLDGLLDKYGGNGKGKGKNAKKMAMPDEPSEEAFAEMGRRKKRKANDQLLVDGSKDEQGRKGEPGSSRNRVKKTKA